MVALVACLLGTGVHAAWAQTSSMPPRVEDSVSPQARSAGVQTVALSGHVPRELNNLVPLGAANPDASLTVQVTLKLRNTGALNQLVQAQQDPSSPQYHRWLTSSEFDARFGPTQQDLTMVANWLAAQGLQVTWSSLADRYVRASGTVARAEQAFGTSIMSFGNGASYANVTEPTVPAQIAPLIGSISGLNNFIHAQPAHSRRHQGTGASPGRPTDLRTGLLWPEVRAHS